MRIPTLSCLAVALAVVAGCTSTPNQPTLELTTSKSPEAYSTCVVEKLREGHQQPDLSQSNRGYRVVLASPVAASNVIEAYKGNTGGRVYVYQRSLFGNDLTQVATACA